MNPRQRYAHEHPLDYAGTEYLAGLEPFKEDRRYSPGMWVRTILAVDR